MSETEQPRRLRRIRNTWLRRAALVVAYPAAMLWVAPVHFLTWPLRVAWRCLAAAGDAIAREASDCWNGREERLLRIGFWAMWSRRCCTDFEAAVVEAKQRVGVR